MNRTKISVWLLAITALAVLVMMGGIQADVPVEAQILTVTKGTITDAVAIAGRLAYADEMLAYTASTGLVAQVYVKPGERVAQGDALIRLEASGYEAAVSAWLSSEDGRGQEKLGHALERTVVRAPMDGNVRQILTAEHAAVTAGTPVMLLSSNRQELHCLVTEADVRRLQMGMWARLSVAGEDIDRLAVITDIGDMEADPLTGQAQCTVTLLPDQHIELPAGASVDADVYIAGREDVPILPMQAITERGTVWWVDGERCTEIPVKNLLNDEMNAWVDLPEGTRVALGEFENGQRIIEVTP